MERLDIADIEHELQRVIPNELIGFLVQPYTGIAHQPDIVTLTGLPEDIIINEIFPLIDDNIELVYAQMNMLRPGTVPNRQVWLRIMRDRLPTLYQELIGTYSMFLHQYSDDTAFIKALHVVGGNHSNGFDDNVELMFLLMVGLYQIPEFTSYFELNDDHWIIYLTLFGGNLQELMDRDPPTLTSRAIMFLARHGVTLNMSAITAFRITENIDYVNAILDAEIMLSLNNLSKIHELHYLPPVIVDKVIGYIRQYQPVNEYEREKLKEIKALWEIPVEAASVTRPSSPQRFR